MTITKYRVNLANGHFEFAKQADAEAWRDANAPTATIEEVVETIAEPEVPRWRVSKDTLLVRVEAAGKVAEVMAAIGALPESERFLFTNFAWFWSNNPRIVAMCEALGLDPDEILSPDEFLA